MPNASGQGVAAGDAGGPCFDGDSYAIAGLRTSPVVGVPGEAFAVPSSVYVNWADDVISGFTGDFGTLVENYGGLDFGIPSTWEAIRGDFDGDGKTDYARVGATGAWLFWSNGDGTFTGPSFQTYQDPPALDFGQPSTDWQTITGDFNGDGKTDYARVGAFGAWLFFGHGDRTFTRPFQVYDTSRIPTSGLSPAWQAISGDFNGDGKTDYARLGDTDAWIFFGSATGVFTMVHQVYPPPVLGFGLPSSWEAITGDFNGDGRTDYARIGNSGAWLYFGNPSGNVNGPFTQSFQTYPTGVSFGQPSAWRTITGDFNGDGKTDYARLGDTLARVFLGNASGMFTNQLQSYTMGESFGLPSPWQTITGDFNGDGKTDYARLGDTGAWLYFGNQQGTFVQGFQSYNGLGFGLPSAWQVITGNFQGNGKIGYARLGGASSYIFVHR
jgi:hypothetical protein